MSPLILGNRNKIISNNFITMANPFDKEEKKEDEEAQLSNDRARATSTTDGSYPGQESDLDSMSTIEIFDYLKTRVRTELQEKFLNAASEEFQSLIKRNPDEFKEVIAKAFTDKIEAKIHAASKERKASTPGSKTI